MTQDIQNITKINICSSIMSAVPLQINASLEAYNISMYFFLKEINHIMSKVKATSICNK